MRALLLGSIALAIVAAATFSMPAAAAETQTLKGAICAIDQANHTIQVIPWDKDKKTWDRKAVRAFKLTPATIIDGETKATVADLDGAKATIKSFHLTGLSLQGPTGASFEIKNISQLLHRRVSATWTDGAEMPDVTVLGLPYLFAGESVPAMVSSSGAQSVVAVDDVTLGCDNK